MSKPSNEELREWFGLTLADGLSYLAIAAVVAMFFVRDPLWDWILATTGVGLSIAACPIGMKRNPKFSEFTNVVKLISYPALVLMLLVAVSVHYMLPRLGVPD